MRIRLRDLPVTLVLCLAIPSVAYVQPVFRIHELTDEALQRIDIHDASVADWEEVVGEPTFLPEAFELETSYQRDTNSLELRGWMGWHDASDRIFVAVEGIDDNYFNRYGLSDDGPWRHDGCVIFGIDGDQSAAVDDGLTWEVKGEAVIDALNFNAIGESFGSTPLPQVSSGTHPLLFHLEPPYADAGGGSDGRDPTTWVTEFFVTPFDRIPYTQGEFGSATMASAERSTISLIQEGETVGFGMSVRDWTDSQGVDADHHILQPGSPHVAPRYFVLGVLAGPPQVEEVSVAIASLDLDPRQGDQAATTAVQVVAGNAYDVELHIHNTPLISGWTGELAFDPLQLRFVEDSLTLGSFLAEGRGLVESEEGSVRLSVSGPTASEAQIVSGLLASVSFEVLHDFSGSANLSVSEVNLELPDGRLQAASGTSATLVGPTNPRITLDFNSETGSQGQWIFAGAESGDLREVELHIYSTLRAPAIDAWGATLHFDPDQVRILSDSFVEGDHLGQVLPLVDLDVDEGTLSFSCVALEEGAAGIGRGHLGSITIELLEGFRKETQITVEDISYRDNTGNHQADTWFQGLVVADPVSLYPSPVELEVDPSAGLHPVADEINVRARPLALEVPGPIVLRELKDSDLERIDLHDGSVDDWVEILGRPTFAPLDFEENRFWGVHNGYDPASMDFRVWVSWHDSSDRIFMAVEAVDDDYQNNYASGLRDEVRYHDSAVTLGMPGKAWLRMTGIGELVGDPVRQFHAPDSSDLFYLRPPFADIGGGSTASTPRHWVTEMYATAFDVLEFDIENWRNDEAVVADLRPGHAVRFSITIRDNDEGRRGPDRYESVHHLRVPGGKPSPSGVARAHYVSAYLGDPDGVVGDIATDVAGLMSEFAKTPQLRSNYPNPFNSATTLRYTLPTTGSVHLELYDVGGQRVRTLVDATQVAGSHSVTWDARDDRGASLASGVYFSRLHVGDTTRTGKLLLLK